MTAKRILVAGESWIADWTGYASLWQGIAGRAAGKI